MSFFSTHDLEKYRGFVASIEMPQADKDDLIHEVGRIMQTFVDQAFGVHPDQIALSARANHCFLPAGDCDSSGTNQEHNSVDLGSEGASNDQNRLRLEAP